MTIGKMFFLRYVVSVLLMEEHATSFRI
uniref:Uncharacterized protein n=1 Tax=Rhizophora mucronata TaxID=61149 RepID=A0A2P2PH87_RHIMU